MKIHAIIPARKGSKRFKNKNKYLFQKQELFLWSVNSAINSKLVSSTLVSTDDDEIIKLCIQKGIKFIKRPNNISGDKSKSIEAINHYIDNLSKRDVPDYVVLLQPTSPLREKGLIDGAIKKIITSKKVDSLIEVCPLKLYYGNIVGNYWKPKFPNGTRKQDLPPIYIPSGRLFIYKTKNLIKKLGFEKTLALVQTIEKNVNIDIPSDIDKLIDVYCQNEDKYSFLLK